MTPKEFTEAGQAFQLQITGKTWGWQSTVAHQIGRSVRTVNRYANGKTEIPEPVARLIGRLLNEQK